MQKSTSKSNIRDLTRGSVPRALLLFALPLLGTSLIQQLYNAVDLIFVGNLVGKEASAAVGSGSFLISCVVDFFIGFGVGINILCAQFFGAEDHRKLRICMHTALALALVSSVILTIVGWICTPSVLRWYNTPESIIPLAMVYMRIYFISLPAIILFNIGSGILRALGDSRTPMMAQLIGGIANVFGNTLFIYLIRFGVAGAALSTMLSQTVAMLIVLYSLLHLPEQFRLRFESSLICVQMLWSLLRIGLPTAVQATIITFSNLVMQTKINILGVDSMAAFAIFYKVDALCYIPMVSMTQALTTFTGQNIGAGQRERVRYGLFSSWTISLLIALFAGGGIVLYAPQIYRMFSNDQDVILLGSKIFLYALPYYFLYAVCDNISAVLRGVGYTFGSMVLMLINICILRLPIVFWLFDHFHSAPHIALIYPITWATNLICFSILYLIKRPSLCSCG